ncbi:MAG: hypothetical protein JJ863_25935 [Deltaproteobacteria bacterium]|nr:hypothetical protein [Deltaproteobacteria bacterium]
MRVRTMMMPLLALVLLAGCGGFRLAPVTPASMPGSVAANMPISVVTVSESPALDAKMVRVLQKYQVAPEMERVLALSLGTGQPGGATVNVVITSIRWSNWGPSRMHTQTTVVGPDGAVLKTFETESVTMRSKAIKPVAQDTVQQVADRV